jgi:Flp pilus assembly protein TadG
MMLGVMSTFRRFVDSTRAVAAVEFAMVMPVLLLLFLGSFDAGNAIVIYMKVRAATYSLGAITNQYGIGNAAISTSVMSSITSATSAILAPYSNTPTVLVISQIKATSAANALVSWSSTVNGTALAQGSTYTGLPTNFAKNSCGGTYPCYVILASVSYTYTPMFGYFITGTLKFSDSIYTTPRISTCVQYNGVPSTC